MKTLFSISLLGLLLCYGGCSSSESVEQSDARDNDVPNDRVVQASPPAVPAGDEDRGRSDADLNPNSDRRNESPPNRSNDRGDRKPSDTVSDSGDRDTVARPPAAREEDRDVVRGNPSSDRQPPPDSRLVAAFPGTPEAQVGLSKGNLIPEITGKDLEGTEFKLSDYQGKVIMLDFWGDW